METYSDITFVPSGSYDENIRSIEAIIHKLDPSIKVEVLGESDNQIAIHFMSGNEGPDIVEYVIRHLAKIECSFARGFIAGDEDPVCIFYYVADGVPSKMDCSPDSFEFLLEYDADSLPEDLRDAAEKGASSYYNYIYSKWSEGLNNIDGQQDYQETINQIIMFAG